MKTANATQTANATARERLQEQLLTAFGEALGTLQHGYFRIGVLYQRLVSCVGSKAAAVKLLNETFPHAKAKFGVSLTAKSLETYANMVIDIAKMISPDGKHALTEDDVSALALTPDEFASLADAVKANKIRVNRVTSKAKAARHGNKDAKKELLNLIKEPMQAKPKTEIEKTEDKANKLRLEIAKTEAKLEELRTKLAETEKALALISPRKRQPLGKQGKAVNA